MGLFSKKDKSSEAGAEPKRSLFARYQDAKRGNAASITDDELRKYTGKGRDEITTWGKTANGVAGNQAAGSITAGGMSGLGGMATGDGYGGWGPGAAGIPKHPPTQPTQPNLVKDGTETEDNDATAAATAQVRQVKPAS